MNVVCHPLQDLRRRRLVLAGHPVSLAVPHPNLPDDEAKARCRGGAVNASPRSKRTHVPQMCAWRPLVHRAYRVRASPIQEPGCCDRGNSIARSERAPYARRVMIRARRGEDATAVRHLLTSAFQDGGRAADLAEALAARPDEPAPALVAESDAALLGMVQLSRGWIDADRQLVEVLILSPLAVLPTHQRRGIGRALCEAAVEQARQLDAPAVFLEGNPDYYARLGWNRASAHGFAPASARIPDVAFQVVVLPAWQIWMRGPIVYNDTFWTLDCVGLREKV
jgi:putative acetyltransferase